MSAYAMSRHSTSLAIPFAPSRREANPRGAAASINERFATPGPSLIVGALLTSTLSSGLWGLILWTAWSIIG